MVFSAFLWNRVTSSTMRQNIQKGRGAYHRSYVHGNLPPIFRRNGLLQRYTSISTRWFPGCQCCFSPFLHRFDFRIRRGRRGSGYIGGWDRSLRLHHGVGTCSKGLDWRSTVEPMHHARVVGRIRRIKVGTGGSAHITWVRRRGWRVGSVHRISAVWGWNIARRVRITMMRIRMTMEIMTIGRWSYSSFHVSRSFLVLNLFSRRSRRDDWFLVTRRGLHVSALSRVVIAGRLVLFVGTLHICNSRLLLSRCRILLQLID